MNGTAAVFGFTFRNQARKKSFVISTVIMIIIVAAMVCIPGIIKKNMNKGGKTGGTLYIVDNTGVLNDVKTGNIFPGYNVKFRDDRNIGALKKEIGKLNGGSLAVLSLKNGSLSLDYYVKSIDGDTPDAETLCDTIKQVSAEKQLKANGVPGPLISKAFAPVEYNIHKTGKNFDSGFVPALFVIILLFFTIYMYGYWVAISIASEKTSRVMELLITSTKPSKIVIGKSLAMGTLGFLQMSLIILTAFISHAAVSSGNESLFGLKFDSSVFTPYYAAILLIYFIMGFALYAMLNAVAGSTVSSAEDVRSAIMPISYILLAAFYFSYAALMMPGSGASEAASIIPFSAPFAMPPRMLMSHVPGWQIAMSVLLLAITTVFFAFISIRIYSAAVLHYGKKLKFSDLLKLAKAS